MAKQWQPTRTLFQGKAVLFAKTDAGELLLGIVCKPKSIRRWMGDSPRADRKRLQAAMKEMDLMDTES